MSLQGSSIAGSNGAAQATDPSVSDFAVSMLRALVVMAARSQRRQADLLAALRGAELPVETPSVRAALRLLQLQGFVSNLVPLSDGGLLLTVTQQGMERSSPFPQWLPLEDVVNSLQGGGASKAD